MERYGDVEGFRFVPFEVEGQLKSERGCHEESDRSLPITIKICLLRLTRRSLNYLLRPAHEGSNHVAATAKNLSALF